MVNYEHYINRAQPSMPSPATIVTYRLAVADGKMVYVTPAESYDQAVQFANNVFPEELRDISPERISFSISVLVGRDTRTVRIGPMAWSSVMSTLSQFEIIDVVVQRANNVDAPPQYNKDESLKFAEEKASSSSASSCGPISSAKEQEGVRAASRRWLEKHF